MIHSNEAYISQEKSLIHLLPLTSYYSFRNGLYLTLLNCRLKCNTSSFLGGLFRFFIIVRCAQKYYFIIYFTASHTHAHTHISGTCDEIQCRLWCVGRRYRGTYGAGTRNVYTPTCDLARKRNKAGDIRHPAAVESPAAQNPDNGADPMNR